MDSGDDEIAEYDGSNALVRRFIPGPAIDQPVAMVTAAGVRSYFHANHQGSVVAMSDASGALAEGPYTYDAYGNASSTAGEPYKFTGRRLDVETGLYYYRARYYSSTLGRFLQTDPVGYKDDFDLYTYVGSDPANREDPSGRCAEDFCIVEGGAAIGAGAVWAIAATAVAAGVCVQTCGAVKGAIEDAAAKVRDSISLNEKKEEKAGPKVNPDKQGKHQPGHRNFQPGKGELTHPDPQGLVDKGAGTGQQAGDKPIGEPGSKERVDFGETIGTHVDPNTGERRDTTVGIIHYGKDDVHIVPARPQASCNVGKQNDCSN